MSQGVKFIHAADLHLDSPFLGLSDLDEKLFEKVKESTFTALNNLVNEAIKYKVDFVLIIGDLFDNNKQSLKAQVKLKEAFDKLNKYNINVYLSYGNHDFIQGNLYPIDYPKNVFVFPNEKVTHFTYYKDEQALANIYGFSYETRVVSDNKIEEYKKVNADISYHIATLHGSADTSHGHATYAPFKISELKDKPFDYWALGHIHKREILSDSPPIVYPGNIQGRHRNESGDKGCYLVNLTKNETQFKFIPLGIIKFKSVVIELVKEDTLHQLKEKINHQLVEDELELIHLTINSQTDEITEWEKTDRLSELIQLINDLHTSYIYKYKVKLNTGTFFSNNYFFDQLLLHLEESEVETSISDLLTHPQARKYPEIYDIDNEELKSRAQEILTLEFYNRGEKK